MNNIIEKRVSRLEMISKKLGEANQITNSVIVELANEISNVVREQVKEEVVTRTKEIEGNIVENIIPVVNANIDTKFKERGLTQREVKRIEAARCNKVKYYLGASQFNDKYTLYSRFFYGEIKKQYCNHFKVNNYNEICSDQVDEAVMFIDNLEIDAIGLILWGRKILDSDYKSKIWENGTVNGTKMKNAYERKYINKNVN